MRCSILNALGIFIWMCKCSNQRSVISIKRIWFNSLMKVQHIYVVHFIFEFDQSKNFYAHAFHHQIEITYWLGFDRNQNFIGFHLISIAKIHYDFAGRALFSDQSHYSVIFEHKQKSIYTLRYTYGKSSQQLYNCVQVFVLKSRCHWNCLTQDYHNKDEKMKEMRNIKPKYLEVHVCAEQMCVQSMRYYILLLLLLLLFLSSHLLQSSFVFLLKLMLTFFSLNREKINPKQALVETQNQMFGHYFMCIL